MAPDVVRPGSKFGQDLRGVLARASGATRRGPPGVPWKSAGVATIGVAADPSGTSTIPPAAWNCASASRSSTVLTGAQKKSGSSAKAAAHSARVRVAKISSSRATSSGRWRRGSRAGGEARVLDPLGMPDHPGQRRPVAVAFEPDDPEPAAVPRGVVVDGRVAHRLAGPDPDRLPPHQRGVDVEPDRVGALAEQRGRHQLAPPGPLPCRRARR